MEKKIYQFKSILFIVLIFTTILSSCQNDTDVIDSDGNISKRILEDPLFEELDKAMYEVFKITNEHSNEVIDKFEITKLKQELKEKRYILMMNILKDKKMQVIKMQNKDC